MVSNNCYKVISAVICEGNWKYVFVLIDTIIISNVCLSQTRKKYISFILWGELIQAKFQANTWQTSNCHLDNLYKDMRGISYIFGFAYWFLKDSSIFDIKIGNAGITRRQFLMGTLYPCILFLSPPSSSVWRGLIHDPHCEGFKSTVSPHLTSLTVLGKWDFKQKDA